MTTYWGMAAGCVPDVEPWEIPLIAGKAGFNSSGMWVDPNTSWQGDALQKTRNALDESGIGLVDVEVIWLTHGDRALDDQKKVIEAGLELGARNALVVSRHDNQDAAIRQFQDLCEMAGSDLRVVLEFGEFAVIQTLAGASEFIDQVSHPTAGILIDLMHINWSGEDLPDLTSDRYPYIQGCDFFQDSASMTGPDYIEAAVDGRCPLGEGEAKVDVIKAMCQSGKDVSLEIRSKPLRDGFPDPYERAQQLFNRCRKDDWL